MEPEEIYNFLSQKVNHRIDIYSAPSKIDMYFKDLGFLTSEFTESNQIGAESEASLFQIVSVKATGSSNITKKIILDFRDKGKIIEKIFKEEIESKRFKKDNDKKKSLFHYKGPGRFTLGGEKLFFYKEEQNGVIQKARERQEKGLRRDTVLFTFEINKTIYASIADINNINEGSLVSYEYSASHGILGLLERELSQDIILINPFWIWCES